MGLWRRTLRGFYLMATKRRGASSTSWGGRRTPIRWHDKSIVPEVKLTFWCLKGWAGNLRSYKLLQNVYPIVNLPYISKLPERAAVAQTTLRTRKDQWYIQPTLQCVDLSIALGGQLKVLSYLHLKRFKWVQRDFNPWPLRCRFIALTNWAMESLSWELVNFMFSSVSVKAMNEWKKLRVKCV